MQLQDTSATGSGSDEQMLLLKVIEFVDKSFGKKIEHYVRTLHWVKELAPDASLALQIAAYSHDIERSTRDKKDALNEIAERKAGFLDKQHLKHHQNLGANIMKEFIEKELQNKDLAQKVHTLIQSHEFGGNDEQNLLKDADSLSFLEVNAERFVNNYRNMVGKDKVKAKLDWMYDRITLPQTKELARPLYEKYIKLLEYST